MTHIIDVLTPFASSDGLALGFVGFAIPKNLYIQIFSIFVSFLRAPDQNEWNDNFFRGYIPSSSNNDDNDYESKDAEDNWTVL